MTYVMEAWVRVPVNEDFFPDGKQALREDTCKDLRTAVQKADSFIEKRTVPTVVEVRQKNGSIKYRVERTAGGIIRTPLV